MKFKVFNIRLKGEYQEHDEATLNRFIETVAVQQVFASVVNESVNFWSVLVYYDEEGVDAEGTVEPAEEAEAEPEIALSPEEEQVYQQLRKWRSEQAVAEGIPAYMVAHNAWLKAIAQLPVQAKDDLLQIKGFGERRIQKYGDDILRVLGGEGRDQPQYLDF